jgi:adenine-specific DNA methylase
MIPKECKRLAEVDFPIAVVSQHCAREKSIRHGHPSTLHLWWARRPLAACRAVLLALLLPDPGDPSCPDDFKNRARNILPRVQGTPGKSDKSLRETLLRFIGDFANWDNSSNAAYIEAAQGLIRAAAGNTAPLVADAFAGGGSIPLEGLRLGCDVFASDLNPVATLILKTMLEEIPRYGGNMAAELRETSVAILAGARRELSSVYPQTRGTAAPIAYIWARTVLCDSCGAEIPLVRSFWLSKKAQRLRALEYEVHKHQKRPPVIEFRIITPKPSHALQQGTTNRGKAVCPACHSVMPPERVKHLLREQRGGTDAIFDRKGNRIGGARLLATVLLRPDGEGREYRLGTDADYRAVFDASEKLAALQKSDCFAPLSAIPDEPLPPQGTLGFRVQPYGMTVWGDLFSCRQKLALLTFANQVKQVKNSAVRNLLSIVLDRVASRGSSLCLWRYHADQEKVEHVFGRQAIPMVWDFAEAVTTSDSTGSFADGVDIVAIAVEQLASMFANHSGQAEGADARRSPLADESAEVWFTDPPYYDAVPYADLSDYFYVWLKRSQPANPLLRERLTPKDEEIVQDKSKHIGDHPKDREAFERMMADAFADARRVLNPGGVGAVVFAHKTTEGWEALLSGMITGGWIITGSWPIATEMRNRLRARDSAALATSVHLICRPRGDDASVGDWADVLRELPRRVGDWMERLQREGVRGADLVFACIGPAMEVYSRYRRVEDAEGRKIPLGGDPTATEPYKRGFLAYVWETVGRLALEQVLGTGEARARNGGAGALEEDSRLTALFLWTLQTTEAAPDTAGPDVDDEAEEDEGDEEEKPKKKKVGFTLIYDVARRFAQPLGIHLDKWEGRIIETEKGVVHLLPVAERGKQLFGEADASAIAHRIERDVKANLNYTFAFMQDVGAAPEIKSRGRGKRTLTHRLAVPPLPEGEGKATAGAASAQAPSPQTVTTLDRLHAAMLLQAGGQANGLRALLREETQRGPDFLRLANALSALYPKDSEEKRLLDAMLLAVPR